MNTNIVGTNDSPSFAGVRFDGWALDPAIDKERLRRQVERIYEVMEEDRWRTLYELSRLANTPETTASAQLRNLRKPRFGGYRVEKRRRTPGGGTFESRLVVERQTPEVQQ